MANYVKLFAFLVKGEKMQSGRNKKCAELKFSFCIR